MATSFLINARNINTPQRQTCGRRALPILALPVGEGPPDGLKRRAFPHPAGMVRDLCREVEREDAAMGLLLALDPPTKGMLSEAASAGRFQFPGLERTYPKVQIFTVKDYFVRRNIPDVSATITPLGGPRQRAKRITKTSDQKPELGI